MCKLYCILMAICLICSGQQSSCAIGKATTIPATGPVSTKGGATQQAPTVMVEVISGQVGPNLTYSRVAAPAQAEPMRDFAKNLETRFRENSKSLGDATYKVRGRGMQEAQKIVQQTQAAYNKNISDYLGAQDLNVTEKSRITSAAKGISLQIDKLNRDIDRVQKK